MTGHARMGYLVSRYPAVSHTFILREVLALRGLGFEIETASINPPDARPEKWTAEERAEAGRTFYVKTASKAAILGAHGRLLVRDPRRYAAGLGLALRLGGADLGKILYGLFYFVEAVVVAAWMERNGLRHLHVHFATPAATVGLIATRVAGVTLSITLHGPDELYDVAGYRLKEKIEGCAFLCAIGWYARSQMMKLASPEHWDKIEVTPLGVDPELFAARPFRPAPGVFEILCVGRLVPAKGQMILLRAAAAIRAAGARVLVRLVGDGPDRAILEHTAAALGMAEDVRFEGAVSQDHIRAFFATADVFALASFAEGIPVALMEAMAMTIPCVATRITGIPELIRDGVDGLLVAPSNAEELAAAILRLIAEPELRRALGEAGRRRVIEAYNLPVNIRRLGEVFDRRLGAAGAVAGGAGR